MNIYAPVIRKLLVSQNTFIERALPVNGFIHVQSGDEVKPFDRVGDCIFSHNLLNLPKEFHPKKKTVTMEFYKLGTLLGTVGNKKIVAPFDGNLEQSDGVFSFVEIANKFSLLSGVWGIVDKVVPTRSVLLKCTTVNLVFALSTPFSTSGELVVFPNPTEILEEYYLESFLKNPLGKIVYLGEYIDEALVQHAEKMKISAIMGGSCSKGAFDLANKLEIPFGVINGFGKMETPKHTFEFINKYSYRQVFFHGEISVLKIPMSPEDISYQTITPVGTESYSFKKVEKGAVVQVFQKEFFGKIGQVDRVSDSSIFVKFGDVVGTSVEVSVPNFFIFEV